MRHHTLQWLSGQRHPLPPAGSRILIARRGRAYFATVDQHDRVMLDNAHEDPRAEPTYIITRPNEVAWWWSYAPAVPGG